MAVFRTAVASLLLTSHTGAISITADLETYAHDEFEREDGLEEGEVNPRKAFLTKFMERPVPVAPLKQCILTPTNVSKCVLGHEDRLRRNKEAYANFHGYALKYSDFVHPTEKFSTGLSNKCHQFWNKIDYVLAAFKDGCDMVMYMDSNIALTNMGLQMNQFLDKEEDAVFNAKEHFDQGKTEVDHGMFVVRGSAKAVAALTDLRASTKCFRGGVIQTELKSDAWNLRVLRKNEAAVFSSEAVNHAGPGELEWKVGDFSVQFQGDRCKEIGNFMDELSSRSSTNNAYNVLKDIEQRAGGHKY